MTKIVIETPKASQVKYLIEPDGSLLVSRVFQNEPIPFNYGYFEYTLGDDGDPLDVFVVGPQVLPKAKLNARLIGGIDFTDKRGYDPKLIAVFGDEDGDTDLIFKLVRNFLKNYKYSYEEVEIGPELSFAEAQTIYIQALRKFNENS